MSHYNHEKVDVCVFRTKSVGLSNKKLLAVTCINEIGKPRTWEMGFTFSGSCTEPLAQKDHVAIRDFSQALK